MSEVYEIKSRHGDIRTITLIDDSSATLDLGKTYYVRHGYGAENNGISFVDPDGGPFFHTGDILAYYKTDAPILVIESMTSVTEMGGRVKYNLGLRQPTHKELYLGYLTKLGWYGLTTKDGVIMGYNPKVFWMDTKLEKVPSFKVAKRLYDEKGIQ